MKNYSFHRFVVTVRGRHDDRDRLTEEIFDNLASPEHDGDFNILFNYIETHGDFILPVSVFDDLYEEYTERLKF